MHFLTSTLYLIPLALLSAPTAHGAALKRADDPHVADFRSYGAPGCSAKNQGVWTFTQSQLVAGCQTFASFDTDDVVSVTLLDINQGCSLTLYTDEQCSESATATVQSGCVSPPTDQEGGGNAAAFGSFLLAC